MNVIQNSDFNSGLTSWTVASGTFAIDAVEGSPAPPSLHATTTPEFTNVAGVLSGCVQISAPQTVDFSVNVKTVSPSSAEADLVGFTDTACTNSWNVLAIVGPSQDGVWTTGSATNIALPNEVHSVNVQLYGFSPAPGSPTDVYFDHIQFGPTSTVVPALVPATSFVGLVVLCLGVLLVGLPFARANYSLKRTFAG